MTLPRPLLALLLLGALLLSGCGLFGGKPKPIPPVGQLYQDGEVQLAKGSYDKARDAFTKLYEHYADSYLAVRARFLVGEAYYREQEYEKAIKEFEAFLTFYPGDAIADLAQYRLAMSYYDQLQTVEKDQGLTVKALAEFQKLVKHYPESRYAPDALAKIEICRNRLAQKELWVAEYYVKQRSYAAALQRLEVILRDYPRAPVIPQTLYLQGDALFRLGQPEEAAKPIRRLVEEFGHTEWARRAYQRYSGLLR